jgi:hypothetical protein
MRRACGQASALGALELTRPNQPSNAGNKFVYTYAKIEDGSGFFGEPPKSGKRDYEVYTLLDEYGNRTGVAVIGITLRTGSAGPIATGYTGSRSGRRAKCTGCGTASR